VHVQRSVRRRGFERASSSSVVSVLADYFLLGTFIAMAVFNVRKRSAGR